MYSYDERMKAINLYNKYQSITAVVRELEYPSTGALKRWVKDYKETEIIPSEYSRQKWKYSEVQKMKASNQSLF